ncbi:glycoside hydrolase family 5 protein [Streptomyces sp. NPDC004976]
MRGTLAKLVLTTVLLLAPLTPGPAGAAPRETAPGTEVAAADDWTAPLSTRGRWIVDADGDRFRLRSGNWHGASGTWNGTGSVDEDAGHHAGENSHRIPLGLDRAPMTEIIAGFQEIGINSVRLPFSNEMIHDTRSVTDDAVAANPGLRGRTPLQVYDAVVRALTDAGLAVILNNHTNTTRWCCGVDGNERWNASRSTEAWENDWLFMAARYQQNKRVVGADLYNEVRRDIWDDPNWGLGDNHDWFTAAQRVGDRILSEAAPDLLIIVEGINWTGIPVDGFAHGRPTLEPARALSHTLVDSGKLVYSAHFYGYTGPNHSGATGIGETTDPRYDYVIAKPPKQVPPPPAPQDAGTWAGTQSAVHGGETLVELSVQGTSDTAVVLTALRVRVAGRTDPAPGNAYAMDQGCGGALTPRYFDVDLDKDRPIARAVAGNDAGTPIPAVRMPYRVSAADPEVLRVTARTTGCDCRWYLELDWSSQGRSGTVRVDDHGRPFRTSGVRGLPHYEYDTTARGWRSRTG